MPSAGPVEGLHLATGSAKLNCNLDLQTTFESGEGHPGEKEYKPDSQTQLVGHLPSQLGNPDPAIYPFPSVEWRIISTTQGKIVTIKKVRLSEVSQ
jgi:hypothetical protein